GGDDLIDAKGGDDVVFGGDGNDIAYGWTGKDTIFGGDGDDFIAGENGIDHLYGEVGHDIISGGRGDDYIDGGAGRDAIKGDTGADILYGGGDEDLIDGGSGADLVIGGTGKDTLEGGMGDDILYGDNYFVPVTDNPNVTNESADPTVSADQVLADLGFAMRLEAEDMRLKNYKVDDQAGASGGKVIKTQGQGRAKTTFNGPSGTYDLIVGYEDQAEGVAEITLEVKRSGSRQEYTWHLDGSAGVGTHTLAGITLEEGDEIILKGRSDSDADLALLDYLDIVTPGLVTEDGNGDTSTVYEVMAGSDGQQADIRIETEDMVLGGGYTPFDTIYASGDAVIQNLTQGIGTATYTYTGETGVYNLYANYFDNILGSASATVLLNGETLHSWQFDKNDFATHDETLGLNITLNQGDVIEVQGKADWLDFAAIDYLMLEAVPEPPSSETITPDESSGVGTVVTIEAEQMNIAGGALRAGDFASEGGYVETAALAASDKDFFSSMAVLNGSSDLASLSATDSITDIYSISSLERLKATSLFTGESGYYNVVVGYYDTTGGEAEIALKIDNQEIDRWYADQDFADVAGTNSLVNRTVAKGIAIDQFDLIELDAIADGADKGNIDYIQFIKVALPTVEAAPVELPDPIRVEAENMTLSGDYSLESQDFSSGDQLVKTSSSLTATTEFDGPTGLYDIVIGYYDEIDGQSPMTVSLDGTELDSWTFDQTLGGYLASAENFVTRTISGVSLEAGAMLALQASRQSNEFARIDYVEFVAVPTPTPATPETVETLSDSGDILRGGSGNDTAYGGAGDDDIYGDSGDDILYGDFAAANSSNAIDARPTAGLVGHWTFDESSGSQVVDTTGAHSGNLTNMTGSEWTAGQIGGGLAFDGSNDRVVIADADALDLSNTLTLTTWVKADHFGDWNGLIVKGDQDIAYGLALASDGGLSFTANYGSLSGAVGSDDWLSNGTITAGQWHHVAVTYDGSNIQFYIDGQLDSSFAKSNLTFGNSDAGLLLGADLAGTHFDGVLDDARVYNRALEIGEIEQLATLQSTSLAPASNDSSQTLTFQQGINGYTGVADTHIRGNGSGSDDDDDDDGEGDANDHFGSETSINIDGNDNGTPVQGLIRFDNLFGNQAGQIALSDTIDSAILELQVSDAGNSLLIYDMLQSWTEYANWNSFTNGIQANNIDAASSAVATTGSVSTGTLQIDITASVRAWQANPSNNRGLTFLSTGNDGVEFWSSESGNGPRLVVDVDRADSLAPAASVGTFDGDDAATIAHADNMLLNNGTLGFSFRADNVWTEQGLFSKDSMHYDDGGHVTVYLESGQLNARFQSTNQTYSVQTSVTSGQDYDVAITFGDRGLEL
ncbi:MAG: LamG-like jellyroll fold domain-containing protein, partial [Cyanobacteria bacterium P01_D01_bin.6]